MALYLLPCDDACRWWCEGKQPRPVCSTYICSDHITTPNELPDPATGDLKNGARKNTLLQERFFKAQTASEGIQCKLSHRSFHTEAVQVVVSHQVDTMVV